MPLHLILAYIHLLRHETQDLESYSLHKLISGDKLGIIKQILIIHVKNNFPYNEKCSLTRRGMNTESLPVIAIWKERPSLCVFAFMLVYKHLF